MHLTAPSYSAPPVVVIDRNRWSPSVGTGGRHRRNAHACTGATATGLNATAAGARLQSCCRHRNSWLVCIPASRATSEATTPGPSAAATIRSFSARDHRRRRCTDVITSTCVLVIGLVLGLVPGLHPNPQPPQGGRRRVDTQERRHRAPISTPTIPCVSVRCR